MGYRNYIGSLPKKKYDEIKELSLKELFIKRGLAWNEEDPFEEDYIGPYDLVDQTHYELGKYVDSFPAELLKPFFLDEATQKTLGDESDLWIVDKDFLLAVIEMYRDKIRKYYQDMLDPLFSEDGRPKAEFMKTDGAPISTDDLSAIFKVISHVKDMGSDWGVMNPWTKGTPYKIEGSETIVDSWKFEHAIFQLVHLYKTFNWKRRVMVYYGY